MLVSRILLSKLNKKKFGLAINQIKKIAILGKIEEAENIKSILESSNTKYTIIGVVNPVLENKANYIGNISQLTEIVKINKISDIIFSANNVSAQKIIQQMHNLSNIDVDFKIMSPDNLSIIGSNSIDSSGDFYSININSIGKSTNIRNKRIFDFIISLVFIAFSPILFFIVKQKSSFFKNIFFVMFGIKSFVGYCFKNNVNTLNLPKIKKGVLNPTHKYKEQEMSNSAIEKMNMIYAKDYKLHNDLVIIFKGLKYF